MSFFTLPSSTTAPSVASAHDATSLFCDVAKEAEAEEETTRAAKRPKLVCYDSDSSSDDTAGEAVNAGDTVAAGASVVAADAEEWEGGEEWEEGEETPPKHPTMPLSARVRQS